MIKCTIVGAACCHFRPVWFCTEMNCKHLFKGHHRLEDTKPSGGKGSGWEENHRGSYCWKLQLSKGATSVSIVTRMYEGRKSRLQDYFPWRVTNLNDEDQLFFGGDRPKRQIKWITQAQNHYLKTKLLWQKRSLFLICHFRLSSTLGILRIECFFFTTMPDPCL